jgi:hypothetical protein
MDLILNVLDAVTLVTVVAGSALRVLSPVRRAVRAVKLPP